MLHYEGDMWPTIIYTQCGLGQGFRVRERLWESSLGEKTGLLIENPCAMKMILQLTIIWSGHAMKINLLQFPSVYNPCCVAFAIMYVGSHLAYCQLFGHRCFSMPWCKLSSSISFGLPLPLYPSNVHVVTIYSNFLLHRHSQRTVLSFSDTSNQFSFWIGFVQAVLSTLLICSHCSQHSSGKPYFHIICHKFAYYP